MPETNFAGSSPNRNPGFTRHSPTGIQRVFAFESDFLHGLAHILHGGWGSGFSLCVLSSVGCWLGQAEA